MHDEGLFDTFLCIESHCLIPSHSSLIHNIFIPLHYQWMCRVLRHEERARIPCEPLFVQKESHSSLSIVKQKALSILSYPILSPSILYGCVCCSTSIIHPIPSYPIFVDFSHLPPHIVVTRHLTSARYYHHGRNSLPIDLL